MKANNLPTYEQIRVHARRLSATPATGLTPSWSDGHGPNAKQAAAQRRAMEHIGLAKAALDDAARYADH